MTPNGRRFLGQFGNQNVSLLLDCLPSHTQVTVALQLYIIHSWDGNQLTHPSLGGPIGPDVWKASVAGGSTLLQTSQRLADVDVFRTGAASAGG